MLTGDRSSCPFCKIDQSRILQEDEFSIVIRDGFPISKGHTLLLPRRHVDSFFALKEEEKKSLFSLLEQSKAQLDEEYSPDGYNVGINDGEAAGQTVGHLHVHLIPRFKGDVEDPRGGIRWLFPEKAKYWED